MKKLTVGVVFGGRSGEHEVSVLSGKNVVAALQSSNFIVVPIFIDKNGRWSINGREVYLLPRPGGGLHDKTSQKPIRVDIYFPILHGTYGEDGTIQGLFEMAGVPYVGAGVLGSAIGMDKEAQKEIFLYHGLPTPHFTVIQQEEWNRATDQTQRRISQQIGFPCFIKPANMGSSVAVTKARNKNEIARAVRKAFRYDTKILIEEYIKGREVDCAVIGPNEAPRVSLPGEIIPRREFFDYRAKYIAEDTEYRFAVPLPEHLKDKIMRRAADVFRITFCQGLARVEFLVTKSEEIFVLEINTLPGCTSHSLFPRLWEASGIPFPEVVRTLISLGLDRWKKRQALYTTFKEGRLLTK